VLWSVAALVPPLTSAVGLATGRVAIPLAPLDVDGNGGAEPLTDGVLVMRYLSGLRGEDLIAGAVDTEHCTRCTAEAIESYLAGQV